MKWENFHKGKFPGPKNLKGKFYHVVNFSRLGIEIHTGNDNDNDHDNGNGMLVAMAMAITMGL